MNIEQKPSFKKAVKKLKKNQKVDVAKAIETLMQAPESGQVKKGDLSNLRVYKFKMVKQETLLAYTWENDILTLTLIGLGSHENFYRDLKR